MPVAKRTKGGRSSSWHGVWRKWDQLTRNGIIVNGNRYSLTRLLQAWALVLAFLYLLLFWTSQRTSKFPRGTIISEHVRLTNYEFFHRRHLIFCVSPGRSGSSYLKKVLDVTEGIIARHEPEPKMNGHFLEDVILEGKRNETFQQRSVLKLGSIRDALEGTTPDVAYAETSHMFVKTFADVVLQELGDIAKISIIFLQRPTRDTVWSQLQLGWFSRGHSGKNLWYYNPNDVHISEKQIAFAVNASNPIESLIGYNADVLQRGVHLEQTIKKMHKKRRWRRVQMRELLLMDVSGASVETGTLRLLSSLGLRADKARLSMLGEQDRNSRDAKKDKYHVDGSIDDVENYLTRMKSKHDSLQEVLY